MSIDEWIKKCLSNIGENWPSHHCLQNGSASNEFNRLRKEPQIMAVTATTVNMKK